MKSHIYEFTRKELISDVDKWTKDKSKLVKKAVYVGVTDDYTVYFKVPSVTAKPSTSYTVKINMVDYSNMEKDEKLTVQEKVRLSLAGDLKVSCTCPAFLYYGYKYILTQLDSNESSNENRFPKIKNPKLQGVMCKHCYIAISAFPMNWNRIVSDIEKKNFLRR